MKFLKLIAISAGLLMSLCMYSQETDTLEIYYDYDLVATGNLSTSGDTLYQVLLVMDTTDVQQLSEVTLEDAQSISQLQVPAERPTTNPRVKKKEKHYQMDMYEWNQLSGLKAKASHKEGKAVKLKYRSRYAKYDQEPVSMQPKRRNLKLSEHTENPAEENE